MLFIFAFALESYNAVDKCIESVVLADAYVVADVELSASLSYQNVACQNELTVGSLNTLPCLLASKNLATADRQVALQRRRHDWK